MDDLNTVMAQMQTLHKDPPEEKTQNSAVTVASQQGKGKTEKDEGTSASASQADSLRPRKSKEARG